MVIWSKFSGPVRFVSIFKSRAAVGEILEPLCWMISVLINNYQMRLNMIWRVLVEADNTLLDLPNSSDQTKAVLLFNQNNFLFKNKHA